VGALALGSSAQAQTSETYTRMTGAQLQQLLQKWGYRAELLTDKEGDPLVRTTTEGTRASVIFFNCDKAANPRHCGALQFYGGFNSSKKISVEAMNQFNVAWRYGKGVIDKDGDPVVMVDLSLEGGVNAEHLKASFGIFETMLNNFKKAIDWK
jgi:hypothetical protein